MPSLRMYDSVTLLCGERPEAATVIRAGLESMRLHVQLHTAVWKSHLLDFFSGKVPCSEYIVICTGGARGSETEREDIPEEAMQLAFPCVDDENHFEAIDFVVTPKNLRSVAHLPGKCVIWSGCGSGRRAFAEAFLSSGCRSYIGFTGEADSDAGTLFTLGFFYHLLAHDRDPQFDCTEQEAFERAARIDVWSRRGTHRVRYHTLDRDMTPTASKQFVVYAVEAGVTWPPPPLVRAE